MNTQTVFDQFKSFSPEKQQALLKAIEMVSGKPPSQQFLEKVGLTTSNIGLSTQG